jgi:hypothetical protein
MMSHKLLIHNEIIGDFSAAPRQIARLGQGIKIPLYRFPRMPKFAHPGYSSAFLAGSGYLFIK